ncbi:hypothetical protein ABT024_06855 [Streptomyces sp. NPDC002812]|uniref:hypothetical protein n=1 Tax=Streptomyces sp. NPDC002812 TaxID=3154434 RepID=UPI003318937F
MEELESLPAPPPPPPVWYRIAAPGPVSGGVMGVGFANGHALITDESQYARALEWFRAEPGYRVETLDPVAPPPEDVPAEPAEPDPFEDQPVEDSSVAATTRRRK